MKRTLNIVVILLVIDLLGSGGLWYGYSSMLEVKVNESNLVDQLNQEALKGKKLNALRQTINSVGKQRDELEKFLIDPSNENQILLLNSFEQLGASTTGLSVDISRFELGDNPKVIHADAGFKGTWAQVFHFLRLIEEYPSRVTINKFDANINRGIVVEPGKPAVPDQWAGNISFDLVGIKQTKN